MHSALTHVPARRHPHQVLVAALLIVSGLPTLLGGPRPGSVNAALPTPLLFVWAAVLTIGGAMVVAAAVVGPLSALFLEMIANPPLSLMCVVYAASAAMLAGLRAVVPVALVAGTAVAFAIRAVQVFKTLRAVRKEIARRRREAER